MFSTRSLHYGICFALIAFVAILAVSYSQNSTPEAVYSKPAVDSVSSGNRIDKPVADTVNDAIASLICGIPAKNGCSYLEGDKGWTTYMQHISNDWKLVQRSKVMPIERWRNKNLKELANDTSSLFYPFAGADFLYANTFFPLASNYILIGLEPVGSLRCCDTMQKNNFINYLEKIRSSLYFSNQLGFFRTRSMEKDLNQEALDGTLPLLVFYIRKTGHHVGGITFFKIDEKGGIKSCRQDSTITGVRIAFYDSASNKSQVLYYLSCDLSDANLKKHPGILRFVRSFGQQVGFLKAASYLMFTSEFHLMRNFMLEQESSLLQDDSGIPYRYFRKSGWNVQLFGTYTQTIDLFKYKFQPDLQEAYNNLEIKHPVPFRIGYNVKFNETNLLFAKRKSQQQRHE